MTKRTFALIFLCTVLLFSCGEKQETLVETSEKKSLSIFKELGKQYKTDQRDTIPVGWSTEIANADVKGTLLDTVMTKRLEAYLGQQMNDGEYYACYRFDLDSVLVGLVTRHFSEPENTIRLWIYDRHTDSLYDALVLAESVADAGETMTLKSWLCKDHNGKWNGYAYSHSHAEPIEEDSADTVAEDHETFVYFYFEGNKAVEKEIPRDQFPARWSKFIEKEE